MIAEIADYMRKDNLWMTVVQNNPLPKVVQICTTMASNRQSYPYKIKVKKNLKE